MFTRLRWSLSTPPPAKNPEDSRGSLDRFTRRVPLNSRRTPEAADQHGRKLRARVRKLAGLPRHPSKRHLLEDGLREFRCLLRNRHVLRPAFERLAGKRVLFVGQAYYYSWYLSRALRGREWSADLLNWDTNPSSQIYYHGEDFRFTGTAPDEVAQNLSFFLDAVYNYDIFHFSNAHGLCFGFLLQEVLATRFGRHREIHLLKDLGKRIVYTNNGCLDGVSQTSFASWGETPVCAICRWRNEPAVCSDERNLAWGRLRNTVADFQCLLGGNRIDFNDAPTVHEVPEFFCLRSDVWRPDLEVPEAFKFPPLPPNGVRLYHGVGQRADRTDDEGVNIKCSHIYRPLIDKLRVDGYAIDLLEPTAVPNLDLRFLQVQADIFLDMLTYGWFGATAREGMMLGKPVVCFIRPEWLESLREELPDYAAELPIVNATPETVEAVLRDLIDHPDKRAAIGKRSRAFALKWHSDEAGAHRFDQIYSRLLEGGPATVPRPKLIAPTALCCANVDMEFPLASDVTLWQLIRGLPAEAPRVRALSAVSLEVPQGRIVGMIGRNGAGKSTLLRVLGGVLHPTRGYVETAGTIAGVFELGGLGNPHLSGREYATRYLRIIGAAGASLPMMLDEIREFSELEEAFDRPVRTYSSGMAARLYFATATAPRHDVYLIDEVLAVGDEHFQTKCHERMRQLLTGGASGVLVTHDWSAVLRLCHDAHVMERGRIAYSGPSDKAIVSYLGIERPPATVARLVEADDRVYAAETGRDANLPFVVEIAEDTPVEMSVSIELLRIGTGWEIMVLSDWILIGEDRGRYHAQVRIPAMPLPAGSYSLNVFLRSRPRDRVALPVVLDIRSWTVGNGLQLVVAGPEQDHVQLPFRISHQALSVS